MICGYMTNEDIRGVVLGVCVCVCDVGCVCVCMWYSKSCGLTDAELSASLNTFFFCYHRWTTHLVFSGRKLALWACWSRRSSLLTPGIRNAKSAIKMQMQWFLAQYSSLKILLSSLYLWIPLNAWHSSFLPYVDSEATISCTRPTLRMGLMTLCLKIKGLVFLYLEIMTLI